MSTSRARRIRRNLIAGAILLGLVLAARAFTLTRLEGRLASSPPPQLPVALRPSTASAEPPLAPRSAHDFLEWLRQAQGKVLLAFLERLDSYAEELLLTNDQIDSALEELKRIQATDAYQERVSTKSRHPTEGHLVYVNRRAARPAMDVLGFRKIANDLRPLPLETRVEMIFELIEGGANSGGDPSHAHSWFRGELRRIGTDAVPLIIRRAERPTPSRLGYLQVLSQIGDPRGIDIMVRALRETPPQNTFEQCQIVFCLRPFREPGVINALVDAVQDDLRVIGDVRLSQRPQPHAERFPVRTYPVRNCAAGALSEVTGNNWGYLFNEDPKTWSAWLACPDRARFDPSQLPRTDDELAVLIENFTFRFMSEEMRTASWEHSHADLSRSMPQDVAWLRQLCARVGPLLVQAYRSITAEFPVWDNDLKTWTRRLLVAIDTPEAKAAAAALGG